MTEGEELEFTGIPSFAPEYMQRARAEDPLKAKHLSKALEQLAEEGAARVFKPVIVIPIGLLVLLGHSNLMSCATVFVRNMRYLLNSKPRVYIRRGGYLQMTLPH